MSSRAKTKRKARPQKPEPEPEPTEEESAFEARPMWAIDKRVPLTKRQKRWFEMFSSVGVFFVATGGITYEVFESPIVSLVCGTIAAIVAVVLVRRGDTIF